MLRSGLSFMLLGVVYVARDLVTKLHFCTGLLCICIYQSYVFAAVAIDADQRFYLIIPNAIEHKAFAVLHLNSSFVFCVKCRVANRHVLSFYQNNTFIRLHGNVLE